jgi:hemerythrin-like domain-containing protein
VNAQTAAFFSRLQGDHRTFRSTLGLLETQVQALGSGQPDYWLMQEVLDYLDHYPRSSHDPFEDRVLQALAEHAPGCEKLLREMRSFHQGIEKCGSRLAQYLLAINAGEVVLIEDIKTAARNYVKKYRRYMSLEERRIFPLAAEVLNPDDWRGIDAAIAA